MRILLAESRGFSVNARQILSQVGEVVEADLDRTALRKAIHDADVLWVRLRNEIDKDIMAAGSKLRIIATNTTGLNHIDLDEARRREIEVVSLRGERELLDTIRGTAELTLGLLLSVVRRVPAATTRVEHGAWDRYPFQGHDLYGKTAGIVGYGRLGRIVAGYLRALGMQVLASDIRPVDLVDMEPGVELVSLGQLLRDSDVVSLHVNLTNENHGLLGRTELEMMKPGAWLVNTARGELVDEAALLDALQSGRVAGAALDVLSDEHDPDLSKRPLVRYAATHDNVLITPHIGGFTRESLERTECFLAERVVQRLTSR